MNHRIPTSQIVLLLSLTNDSLDSFLNPAAQVPVFNLLGMIALIGLLSMVATRKIRRRWNYFFPRFFMDIIYPIIPTGELIIYKYINKTIFYAKEGLIRTQRLYLLNPSGDYRKYLESG
jgi:hypothetical protein